MLAITRRNVIKNLLQEQKSVTITDLAARLNVTKETIRRDLRVMENAQELIRTHGGAYILEGVQNDIDISTRQDLKTDEKEILAEKCNALIRPGDIIFLDSSTTAWFLARKILERNLTVLTPSLEIANILNGSSSIHLFLIGGEYSQNSRSFTGPGAARALGNYYIDKAFLSPRSVSLEYGLTDTNEDTALLHQVALEHAKETYIVVDHSKLDKISFSSVAPLEKITGIVLDSPFSREWQAKLSQKNVACY